MSEAWILELLSSVRDAARAQAMTRLAEHLDDAILLAASEFHEALEEGAATIRHDGRDTKTLRELAARGLH